MKPDSLRTPSRQRLGAVVVSVLIGAALWLSALHQAGCEEGCDYEEGSCAPRCDTADDCDDGLVCVLVPSDEVSGIAQKTCTRPCDATSDCPAGATCRCVDGADDGVCDLSDWTESYIPGPFNETCAGDYDYARACSELCDCPCGYHHECYGGLTHDDCYGGCLDARQAFPSCTGELDAYLFCGERGGQCMASCPSNGFPCWSVSPETSCPDELDALRACAATTGWSFFYPVAEP